MSGPVVVSSSSGPACPCSRRRSPRLKHASVYTAASCETLLGRHKCLAITGAPLLRAYTPRLLTRAPRTIRWAAAQAKATSPGEALQRCNAAASEHASLRSLFAHHRCNNVKSRRHALQRCNALHIYHGDARRTHGRAAPAPRAGLRRPRHAAPGARSATARRRPHTHRRRPPPAAAAVAAAAPAPRGRGLPQRQPRGRGGPAAGDCDWPAARPERRGAAVAGRREEHEYGDHGAARCHYSVQRAACNCSVAALWRDVVLFTVVAAV